ncbi:MAG: hypothetical protein WCV90_03100 [Candidatus Woesearchaeota archaeon]|jgi:hypothetical protein
MFISLPPELRILQYPWFDDSIPENIQEHVRLGHRIDHFLGNPIVTGWLTGGAGTINWRKPSPQTLVGLVEQVEKQYFPENSGEEGKSELKEFLSGLGVSLNSHSDVSSPIFGLSYKLLSILPPEHLGHPYFRELELGGWGNGDAKQSGHLGDKVHLYQSATQGPVRNFVALLIHEVGHAYDNLIDQSSPLLHKALLKEYRSLVLSNSPFLGIDYLLGEPARIDNCKDAPQEFIAENYLIYVSQGERFQKFLENLSSPHKENWRRVYNLFKNGFDGVEYR